MDLSKKLKELRIEIGITQERAAQLLGTSSQTISKWERALTMPDIQMMPKIAMLYRVSLDELYDMNSHYSDKHHDDFRQHIEKIYCSENYDLVFNMFADYIELHPEQYWEYLNLFDYSAKHGLHSRKHFDRLVFFLRRAERLCHDLRIVHSLYRSMVKICSSASDEDVRKYADVYFNKLPYFRCIRETCAHLVLKGDELEREENSALLNFTISASEIIHRKMIRNAQTDAEKLRYLIISADIMYAVTENKAVGFYEMMMLDDFRQISALYFRLGDHVNGEKYYRKLKEALLRHISDDTLIDKCEFSNTLTPHGYKEYWKLGFGILDDMKNQSEFSEFRDDINELSLRYRKYYDNEKGTDK